MSVTNAERAVAVLTDSGMPEHLAWPLVNRWIVDRQPNLITEAKGHVAWLAETVTTEGAPR